MARINMSMTTMIIIITIAIAITVIEVTQGTVVILMVIPIPTVHDIPATRDIAMKMSTESESLCFGGIGFDAAFSAL